MISGAMHVAKQRNLMSAKTRNDKQPLAEFMQQKKEMFRTELANKTVSGEIKQLTYKEVARRGALGESTLELDQDKRAVIDFVQVSNEKRRDKENMEKKLLKQKAAKEEMILKIDNDIQLRSVEINKTLDTLSSYQQYKEFITKLAPEGDRLEFEVDRE